MVIPVTSRQCERRNSSREHLGFNFGEPAEANRWHRSNDDVLLLENSLAQTVVSHSELDVTEQESIP